MSKNYRKNTDEELDILLELLMIKLKEYEEEQKNEKNRNILAGEIIA